MREGMPAPQDSGRLGRPATQCRRMRALHACWPPGADALNESLLRAFSQLDDQDYDRRSHFIDGRFENLYVGAERLPGVARILSYAERRAQVLLEPCPARLRCGFWLNAMHPGQRTSRHSHEESDELLSGVYYVSTPPGSGAVMFHDGPFETRVVPRPGLMLLFPPDLPHSVETHNGDGLRLSVAFNIGPAG
jgi:hypothetical protein